jgi:hypothetical protein
VRESQWFSAFVNGGAWIAAGHKVSAMQKTKQKEAGHMFTTTISLSPEVHQKLKHLAVDLRVPFRDLIRMAIDGYLRKKALGVEASRDHSQLLGRDSRE